MKETKTGRRQAPARSIEGREQQMIALSMDLAEKKLRDGTASNQLICHFLKLGTIQAGMDRENTKADVDLKKAKVKSIEAQKNTDEKYQRVIDAIKRYQGLDEDDDYYD